MPESLDAFDTIVSNALSTPSAPVTPVAPSPIEQNTELTIATDAVAPPVSGAEVVEPPVSDLPQELQDILDDDGEIKQPEAPPVEPPVDPDEPPPTVAGVVAPNPIDLNSSRGKRIYNGYKFFKAVETELGVLPTVDEVKEYHRAHLERLAMENEFTSGDPRAADNWVANWDRTSPQGMVAVAAALPERLIADRNFDAYNAVATPVITRFIGSLYDTAMQIADPESKARMIDAARIAESRLTGKFRSDEELTRQPDPMAARQSELDGKLAKIREFESQQSYARAAGIVADIDSSIGSFVAQTVDATLAPLKTAYPQNTSYVKDCQRTFAEEVVKLANRSPSAEAYRREVEKAARGDSNARQRAVNLYGSMVQHAVQTLARPFLRERIKSSEVVRASAARHAQLTQATSQNAPQSAGGPSTKSLNATPQKGETLEQAMTRLTGVAF